MDYDFEDFMTAKKVEPDNQRLPPQDSDKWEMDVNVTLDEMYHTWLGEKGKGAQWRRDERITRRMNEDGASFLISEIKSRFNLNSQFSVLSLEMIEDIASETSELIMKKLKYDYWKYEINPNDLEMICNQIFHALFIFLMISYEGGMRTYKGDKTKTIINKQEMPGGGAY